MLFTNWGHLFHKLATKSGSSEKAKIAITLEPFMIALWNFKGELSLSKCVS